MTTLSKEMTVEEFVSKLYQDNEDHFEFMFNMGGGDCDCNLHLTMDTIFDTMGWPKELD